MAESDSSQNQQPSADSAQDMMLASVNQSIALAIQDATDLMRNINTVETTVIGIASAKWLAEPANVAYEQIIKNATENITFAAKNLATVGENAKSLLGDLSGK